MTVFAALVLFVSAAFNVFTWPAFLRRVAKDPRATDASGHRTRFYTVHLALVTAALVLAVAAVVAGIGLLVA